MSSRLPQAIKTEVYRKHPSRFSMSGQKLSDHFTLTDETIGKRRAMSLFRYARECMKDAGFWDAVQGWAVTVETTNSDRRVDDRAYGVTWQNDKGGYISVVHILMNNGKPDINHGFSIGSD